MIRTQWTPLEPKRETVSQECSNCRLVVAYSKGDEETALRLWSKQDGKWYCPGCVPIFDFHKKEA